MVTFHKQTSNQIKCTLTNLVAVRKMQRLDVTKGFAFFMLTFFRGRNCKVQNVALNLPGITYKAKSKKDDGGKYHYIK